MAWTIEVAGAVYNYKSIEFETALKTNSPTEFSAVIQDSTPNYFDLIEIKNGATVEWRGFFEEKEDVWTKDGKYLRISGRDTKVILWKKYTENFSNMHKDTAGFFGRVSAVELIKFFLRTPKSDSVHDFPYNKAGWGIDASRIEDVTAGRTSVGDPNWAFLRRRGYGWRNTGSPWNTDIADVDALVSGGWDNTGAGDDPWLDIQDEKYIYSDTVDETEIFSFENLSTLDATANGVNRCTLTVSWRPDITWYWWVVASMEIWLSPDGGTSWVYIATFGGRTSPLVPNVWRIWTRNVSHIIDTVAKADAAQIKIICKSSDLTIFITHAFLSFSYQTGGEQDLEDVFDIPFQSEEIMGIYIESRMDNDSYPRNYKICTVGEDKQDFDTDYAPNEVDPNNHIAYPSDYHIDFNAFNNETAYVYDDFGVNYFEEYFRHIVDVKVVTDPVPSGAGSPNYLRGAFYALTNDLGEMLDLELNHSSHISLSVYRDSLGADVPMFRLYAHTTSTLSPELTEGLTYRFTITRVAGTVTVVIDEETAPASGVFAYWYTLSRTGLGTTKYRYLMAAVTANNTLGLNTDMDIDDLILETETDLLGGTISSNTFRDIIHSWTPTTIDNIRIRIMTKDTAHAWAISQIYIYKAEDCDYRVYKEAGCTPTYAEEQYIQDLDFESAYTTAIGPLNIPRARLIDVLNVIVRKCHTAYVPYEWWLALDANNTFHFKNRRGSDISGTVTFVKGVNLESADRHRSVRDTVQRVTIEGRGKGKRQEEVSSDWINDTTAMGNANTFFEDVISRKTEVDKDEAIELAEIFLGEEGEPKDQKIIYVSNDTYTPLQYNVGDEVGVTDSLIGLPTLTVIKIYNITKKIDKNGPHLTLYCGYQREDDGNTWEDIYRRLKEIEISESLVADWMGEGVKEDKVDSEEALTTFFEKSAKNDEEVAGKDIKDPAWYMEPNPDAFNPAVDAFNAGPAARGTPASLEYPNGRQWIASGDWMEFKGTDVDAVVRTLLVELRGDTGEELDVYMRDNPKLVFEMKCSEVNPKTWFDGDYFDIGLYNYATSKGFFFRVTRSAGAVFTVEACWNLTGSDEQTMTLRTITVNTKYRFEIITEVDRNIVIFNVYDLDVDEKYPVSVVAINIDLSILVRPLSMFLSSDHDNDANMQAIVYIYKFRTEWERVSS